MIDATRTSTLSVRRYGLRDRGVWDAFVAGARSRHFMFQRGYMDYHGDRLADHSLLVHDDGRLVAALPANVAGDAFVSHSGLTFAGFLHDASLSTRRMLEVFAATRAYLIEAGFRTWVYKAVPHIYHVVPAEEDLYALFRHDAQLVRRDVASAIPLDARIPYAKGRRSALKGGLRAGIELSANDDFHSFMALQRDVLDARYGAEPVHTGDELALLASRFGDGIKLHTAKIEDRLVAGMVVYETPVVAHAQYIAVSEEGRDAHALDVLADALIASYVGRKRWWDFGCSTEQSGWHLNEALIRNKESYGARAVVYDQYMIEL